VCLYDLTNFFKMLKLFKIFTRNLISSSILSSGNTTMVDKDIEFCGVHFCPADVKASGDVITQPSKSKIYLLAGIYLGCAILAAILVAILVDPLTRYRKVKHIFQWPPSAQRPKRTWIFRYGEQNREGGASKLSGKRLLSATFRQMMNPIQIVIIPLTIWSGMEQGFFGSDFTQVRVKFH